MLTRRSWLANTAALSAVAAANLCLPRVARAFAPVEVAAPSASAGALVAAVGGDAVAVTIDESLPATRLRVGGDTVEIGHRILLKGRGPARSRFLDDARNAAKLGANIRDALAERDPARAAVYTERHRDWSRPFAKKVLRWQARLQKGPVSGQRVRDVHGRVYLLEWAGAVVDPKASFTGPAALAQLPAAPSGPTLADYEAYIERLVTAAS